MVVNEHWIEYYDSGAWRRWTGSTVKHLTGDSARAYVKNGTRIIAQYSDSILEKAIEAAEEKMRDPLFAAYPHRIATFDSKSGKLLAVVWSHGNAGAFATVNVAEYATPVQTYEPTKEGFVATPWGTQFET